MRIGIFTCNYRPLVNGLSSSIEIFSREFRARGHQVFIFAPNYPGYHEEEEGVFRFPSLRVPTHHQYTLPIPFSPEITAVLPRLQLDLIHAQHPFLLGIYGLRAARRLRLPLVFTHHTLYEKYTHYLPLLSVAGQRWTIHRSVSFANQADLVIAPTQGLKEILRSRGVRSRIEVVPTGVEVEEKGEEPIRPSELNLPDSARILLSVGRLAKEKNLYPLLEAFSHLVPDFPDAYLVLVGDGDERSRLEDWVSRKGVKERVRFVGSHPRRALGRYYQGACLLLFSSLSEAQGLVVAEAMAQGLPVVALRSFAVEDLIEDGINGYLADGTDAFRQRIRELLCDEERRRSFSERAREKAREFAAPALAERMLSLYRELVEARRAG
ncbi:MAG: glycosyltransferase [candidate division NC10 bacterium]|nr:glycosyltransferase [candidate division NC10 bacterium]